MHYKGEGGLKSNFIEAYYYADLSVKNKGGENAIKLKQSIENSLTPQQLLDARSYRKLTNDVKKIDEEIEELFLGNLLKNDKKEEPEELDESVLINMSCFEINDHYRETFQNDTFNSNSDWIEDDFEALKSLDLFVQYKCVQNLKKLTISPFYFIKSEYKNLHITDIAPLVKIKNLEELFFMCEHDDGIEVDYYSSEIFLNIKNLKLSGVYDCRFLLNFPNIESLTLNFSDFIGENYKLPKKGDLSHMKNLKNLELFDCPQKISDKDKVELDHLISGISTLDNLEKLVIYIVNGFEEFTFNLKHLTSQSLKKLNKLETVVIMGSFYLDVDVNFANELPNLKTLILDNNIEIVDKSILDDASFKTVYEDCEKYIYSNREHEMN